ncbi:hypothetical protein SLEP1_g27720 [Rubroshorea leprosula]|uniref:Uncharacterized protein n=1 Tax=Rubroshorea leprosula TaxID=152421 RepID=A0AAV5JR97_9ROSI|nr:hypothetical protein SLEP1_g27720 [Rubroshorea leprosula]
MLCFALSAGCSCCGGELLGFWIREFLPFTAAGFFPLLGPVLAGKFCGDYTLAVTYRGDVYFVPVLYPFFVIVLVGML